MVKKTGFLTLFVVSVIVFGLFVVVQRVNLRPILTTQISQIEDLFNGRVSLDGAVRLTITGLDTVSLHFGEVGVLDPFCLDEVEDCSIAKASHLGLEINWIKAALGQIDIERIVFSGVEVSATEPDVRGIGDFLRSFVASEAVEGQFEFRALRRVEIHQAKIFVGPKEASESLGIGIDELFAYPAKAGMAVGGSVVVNDAPVHFQGRTGPFLSYLKGNRIFLRGALVTGKSRLDVSGHLGDLTEEGFAFDTRGDSPQLEDLVSVFGLSGLNDNLPASFYAHVKGTLNGIEFQNIRASFGEGDLRGDFAIRRGDKVYFTGALTSDTLDLNAFEGARMKVNPSRLFSNKPLPLEPIKHSEVDFKYSANRVLWNDAELRNGQIRVLLLDRVLAVNPISVEFRNGLADSAFVLDARSDPEYRAELNINNLDLDALFSDQSEGAEAGVRVDFAARLEGAGDRLSEMAANSDGQTNLLIGPGQLSPRTVDALMGDLYRDLQSQGMGDVASRAGPMDLTCVVSRFDISKGKAKSSFFVAESADTITTGSGQINLGTESFRLRLAPRPKDPAQIDNAVDVAILGGLMRPSLEVVRDKRSRGIAGVLGRIIQVNNEDTSLLPLIDWETGKNRSCMTDALGPILPVRNGRTSILDR